MNNELYLLGIDVGFRNTGVSLFKSIKNRIKFIDGCTIITVKDNKKKNARVSDLDVQCCIVITKRLNEFILKNKIENKKVLACCEFPHGGARGARSNRTMGIATGIISTFLTLNNYVIETVTPLEVKISVTNKNSASKQEIIKKIFNKKFIHKHKKNIESYIPTKYMEHFADSVGAVIHVIRNSDIYKIMQGN